LCIILGYFHNENTYSISKWSAFSRR